MNILEQLEEPTEDMIDAAMCGWNNVPIGFNFSPYQRSEVTRESWKRVFKAIAEKLREQNVITQISQRVIFSDLPNKCQCEHKMIRCDNFGCRCTSCGGYG